MSDNEIYLHINNGGITIKVNEKQLNDTIYPELEIYAGHFYCQTNNMKIPMSPFRLREIGEWLIKEADESEKYYNNYDDSDWDCGFALTMNIDGESKEHPEYLKAKDQESEQIYKTVREEDEN